MSLRFVGHSHPTQRGGSRISYKIQTPRWVARRDTHIQSAAQLSSQNLATKKQPGRRRAFIKRQRFVNGELVEESVEELDRDEAKAIMKEREAEVDLISQELHKAFKDHQKVWERLLQAPRNMFKANTGWFPEGFEDNDYDAVDSAPDIGDQPSEPPSRSVRAPSRRGRPTSRK